ncbi:Hsp70 family protein [Pelagicoccus sp. SDUM812003]|uniref:Hsp70 family protein n=1 Tax=Pelagicoccus sp. SDUM812003 TaxID=3041267 RepID=UPI00280CF1B9|nr:Hsp70 family protein [Pelagicoccus sp. SDUM812003]MDQ8204857.1 Hsp70 family protein [Pelagicoccus sp. SDUM812003]
MDKKFVIGIDLGTSNSAVSLCDLESGESRVVNVTQILAPNQVGERPSLPSALYLPEAGEFSEESLRLPWSEGEIRQIVGSFAREHGAQVPDRLVTSAKSWLSNPHIDPQSAVLPWNSESVEAKVSAVEASRRYLQHLKAGVLHAEQLEGRQWNWDDGQIVITVPASFDEVARKLTADAAAAAGFPEPVLLEEPQAAFYAWTEQAGADWRKQVQAGDVILVCDVGGGTADFSLIAVSEEDGNLAVERVSVGEHILLGGDNMDLALAYTLQAQLEDGGSEIDDWQFLALVHAASQAKAKLFEDLSLHELPISVPSRGSSLFAGTVSTTLSRETLEAVVIDGFFAMTAEDDMPVEEGGAALQEFGLPYASDAVVSKHLARFLARSLQNVKTSEALSALIGDSVDALDGSLLKPTAVLFNGGVFKADAIRARVLDLLASWCGTAPRELQGFQPDLAVAKGAACYGRNRVSGQGIRIRAGTARSYYVGLESSRPAVPGFKPPVKAVCVVPQGMEEGSSHMLEGRRFGLVTGKAAVFRFFSSEIRSGDEPGDVVSNAERNLEETSKLEITLPPMEAFPDGQPIPVFLNSVVTELGNLELWMQHADSDRRWKVEFQVRME